MRQHGFRQVGGALRNQAEADAIFPTLLGDAFQNVARQAVLLEPVGRDISVRFLANNEDGRTLLRLARPDGKVECHATDDGDHDLDDVGRQAGQVDDGDRLAARRQAEQLFEQPLEGIRHQQAGEHEAVARVVAQFVKARLESHVRCALLRLVELAHLRLQHGDQV